MRVKRRTAKVVVERLLAAGETGRMEKQLEFAHRLQGTGEKLGRRRRGCILSSREKVLSFPFYDGLAARKAEISKVAWAESSRGVATKEMDGNLSSLSSSFRPITSRQLSLAVAGFAVHVRECWEMLNRGIDTHSRDECYRVVVVLWTAGGETRVEGTQWEKKSNEVRSRI